MSNGTLFLITFVTSLFALVVMKIALWQLGNLADWYLRRKMWKLGSPGEHVMQHGDYVSPFVAVPPRATETSSFNFMAVADAREDLTFAAIEYADDNSQANLDKMIEHAKCYRATMPSAHVDVMRQVRDARRRHREQHKQRTPS